MKKFKEKKKWQKSNCDTTKKFNFTIFKISKTKIVKKNKKKTIFDKTQKLIFGQDSKTQIVTKLQSSNCDYIHNLNCDGSNSDSSDNENNLTPQQPIRCFQQCFSSPLQSRCRCHKWLALLQS